MRWRRTTLANAGRDVMVNTSCETQDCVVVVHIIDDGGRNWVEAHLTAREARSMRAALGRALAKP